MTKKELFGFYVAKINMLYSKLYWQNTTEFDIPREQEYCNHETIEEMKTLSRKAQKHFSPKIYYLPEKEQKTQNDSSVTFQTRIFDDNTI